MRKFIEEIAEESIAVKRRFFESNAEAIEESVRMLLDVFKGGRKILIFGNGGSAADSQHVAAELVNRFLVNRRALPAIALTTDTSIITSIANDSDFDHIFSRQIEALGEPGDAALAISTSGNSPNIKLGLLQAGDSGLKTLALLGKDGGAVKGISDIDIIVRTDSTPRIQECHITYLHILCELIEQNFTEK